MSSRIIFIMGVSGSGKTTIGERLSAATQIPFFDADDYHSSANKHKMHNGHPLNDDDRRDWLLSLNRLARGQAAQAGAIIACSALKKKYRTVLAEGVPVSIDWVLLEGNFQLIKERIETRKGHFMTQELLQSQFETLETPADALLIDVIQPPGEIVDRIIRELGLTRAGE